jgi:Ran GTPase-activating protein (RanGAP) involved in mRNA processing and transport
MPSRLPPDIWMIIFNKLSESNNYLDLLCICVCVNKSWHLIINEFLSLLSNNPINITYPILHINILYYLIHKNNCSVDIHFSKYSTPPRNCNFKDFCVKYMLLFPYTVSLDLRENYFGSDGIATLWLYKKYFINLEYIDISCNMLDDKACDLLAEFISHCKNITYLNLRYNSFEFNTDAFDKLLVSIKELKYLNLSDNNLAISGSTKLIKYIDGMTQITHLILKYCGIPRNLILELAVKLHNLQNLYHFDVSGSFLEKPTIIETLLSNISRTCRELILHGCNLDITFDVGVLLSKFNNLELLDLSNNGINDNKIDILISVLDNMPCIKCINMTSNYITRNGIKKLLPTFSKMKYIECIYLENNCSANTEVKIYLYNNYKINI